MTRQQDRIEPVGEKDYDEIARVWEASVRATHDFLPESDIERLAPLVRERYLPAVRLFCIRDEAQRIAAFIGLCERHIEMLFVRPDRMGRGLGRQLLLFAVERCGARSVDVNEQNPQAAGFYRHMGFRVAGRSPLDSEGAPFPILHLRLPE
ncbi:GNAT family N-acetyltransferase [uncultured Alistipes sp.]|uniref:GNAT family N-acetyltransferase n=1 Tax=uncultured Alistipes sp. TaxID=538949 RepID=UPI0026EBA4B0|nr:GNAT family N-acetyltransferase [uncultured Alistipes sp.]